jgi:DNA-directed RNA polymerase specialized sigma24 family protein
MKRRTKRRLTHLLNRCEHTRRRQLCKAALPSPRRRSELPADLLQAIQGMIPAALNIARCQWVHDAKAEVLGEFYLTVSELGRSMQRPGSNDRQYLLWMLCKSANRIKAQNQRARQVDLDPAYFDHAVSAASEKHAQDKSRGKSDEGEQFDPLQTLAEARKVLATLSQKVQRTALRHWEDKLSIEKIAVEDGVTIRAINMRLHHARTHLIGLNITFHLRGPRRRR